MRQFCQVGWNGAFRPQTVRIEVANRYPAVEHHHPFADAILEISRRSWVSAPVTSGWGLSIAKPGMLDELMDWADVVLVEFPWQFEYCRRRAGSKPLVLASHNIELEKFRDYAVVGGVRQEGNYWLKFIEKSERHAARNATLVVAVSEADRNLFVNCYGVDPAKIVVAPNGADTRFYQPVDETVREHAKRELGLPDKPAVLFMGSDVPPNRAGVKWLERLSCRTNQFTFLAVGPVSRRIVEGPNLRRFGEVDDLRPFLRAADFSLCSVEYGGGTKIKLWESLAAGLPTVAFQESLRGTDLLEGEHVLISEPNVDSLLNCLGRLTADPELAARLARNGRHHVVAHHNWTDIGGRLAVSLEWLVNGRPPGRIRVA